MECPYCGRENYTKPINDYVKLCKCGKFIVDPSYKKWKYDDAYIIEREIDLWHTGLSEDTLNGFLGLTWNEYKAYIEATST